MEVRGQPMIWAHPADGRESTFAANQRAFKTSGSKLRPAAAQAFSRRPQAPPLAREGSTFEDDDKWQFA